MIVLKGFGMIWRSILATVGLVLVAAVMTALPAAAKFQRSTNQLYVDLQKLSTSPEDKSKYYTYAIVKPGCKRCPATYLIMAESAQRVRYLGAFRCDKSFQVLDQSTHGMKDILCRNWTDREGAALARFLRYDPMAEVYK